MPVLDDPAGPPQGGAVPARRLPSTGGSAASAVAVDDSSPRARASISTDETGGASKDAVKDPMIGQTIAGRYKIEARLGEGGMGSVYRVEHTHMRKRLALKVLHREMTSQPEIVARFEREAMAAAHIEHPNVAGATDFGKLEDGSCYLVLEYVEGTSLRALIDEGPVPSARAVNITVQMLSALKRAHELGIVHRDLKPENVLLVDKDGDPDFVKVLDFGIARVPIGTIGSSTGDAGPSLTRAGMVYGTPEYMAPEQALGQDVDGRSDQYAVGVMIFEMLAGKRPYDNKDKVALLGQHVAGPIPSVRSRAPEGAVTASLDVVVTKMLGKSPSSRYADATDAAEALMIASTGASDLPIEFRGEPSDSGRVVIPTSSRARDEVAETVRPPSGLLDSGETMVPVEPARARFNSRVLAMLGASFAVLFVLVVVIFTRKPEAIEEGTRDAPKTASKSEGTAPPTLLSEGNKAKVQAALGRVTAGEIETGIKDLETLNTDYPNDPIVQKALAQAYSKGKRHVDALGIVKKMVTAHPEMASDVAVDAIFDDALAAPAAVDSAFGVLEGPMKSDGARILYAMAYEGRGPGHLATRARKALADPEVAKIMPSSIRGVIELRNAPHTCTARKEIIDKYKTDFDATALPVLRGMTKTTGCGGFFKRADCWPCMREDSFLTKVIAAIEERTKK